jgi:hypothetical protein
VDGAIIPNLLWRYPIEHNDIQTGSTIVRPDLDWHHLLYAGEFFYRRSVIFRESATRWAESILLKHNQASIGVTAGREPFQTFLNRADKTEHKHRHRCPAKG